MPHTATDSVTTNPDPTKWADRSAEFAGGALAAALGVSVLFVPVGAVADAVAAVGAGAGAVAGAVAAHAVAVGAAAAVVSVSVFAVAPAGAAAVFAAADTSKGQIQIQIQKRRPVAQRLGMAFCTLAVLGVGAMAHKLFPAPPQKPAEPAPMAVFNITAPDCGATLVQKKIEQIKRDGFSVTCSPTP